MVSEVQYSLLTHPSREEADLQISVSAAQDLNPRALSFSLFSPSVSPQVSVLEPLSMLAAQCSRLSSRSPPPHPASLPSPVAEAPPPLGKAFAPWRRPSASPGQEQGNRGCSYTHTHAHTCSHTFGSRAYSHSFKHTCTHERTHFLSLFVSLSVSLSHTQTLTHLPRANTLT